MNTQHFNFMIHPWMEQRSVEKTNFINIKLIIRVEGLQRNANYWWLDITSKNQPIVALCLFLV